MTLCVLLVLADAVFLLPSLSLQSYPDADQTIIIITHLVSQFNPQSICRPFPEITAIGKR